METISLKQVDSESKIALLRELGFESDGEYVLNFDVLRSCGTYGDCHCIDE